MRTPPLVAILALSVGCSSTQTAPVDATPRSAPEATPPVVAPLPAPATSASAKAPTGDVKTLFVDAKKVACEGEGQTECLRVKESADGAWMLFYRTIEGFSYEPGYVYELRVEVTQVAKPPADSSSRRHRLVEIVSKRKP
jgi:hypothetical protein